VAIFVSIVIDIVIISAFLGFEIIIAAAPFFIPFFMSGETKHIGRQWMNNILMCLMQLVMISIVLKMMAELNKFAFEYYFKHLIGKQGILGDIYMIIFIPLLGLGLVWQSLSMAKMLFPPSGGFVGTAVGAPVAAAVGYVGHTAARAVSGGR
jgi:type IV secretory pathway VirB6-like protein